MVLQFDSSQYWSDESFNESAKIINLEIAFPKINGKKSNNTVLIAIRHSVRSFKRTFHCQLAWVKRLLSRLKVFLKVKIVQMIWQYCSK